MIGVIGGTGLYKMDELTTIETLAVETPFGSPSALITVGELSGKKVAFLPRHGLQHQILPSEINFRANVWALKSLGVKQIIGVSAVGSLVQEVRPGDLALPDQYIDFTKGTRDRTFFGKGLVAHISTAQPVCARLSRATFEASQKNDIKIHDRKTYVCVEGPRLGTKAESHFLRNCGAHLVGMTNVPEVFLAREAQLCYCTIAVATDYDCWLDDPSQHASVEMVMELYKKNIGRVQQVLKQVIISTQDKEDCSCRSSLKYAVLSPDSILNNEQKKLLEFLRS